MSAAAHAGVRFWDEDGNLKQHCEAWLSNINFMTGVEVGTIFSAPYIRQLCLDTDSHGLPAPFLLLDEDTVFCNTERFEATRVPIEVLTSRGLEVRTRFEQPVVEQAAFYPFAKSAYALLKHYSARSVSKVPPPETLPIPIPDSTLPPVQAQTFHPPFIHTRPVPVTESDNKLAPSGSRLGTLPPAGTPPAKIVLDPNFSPPIMGSSDFGRPIAVFAPRNDFNWATYCGMYIFQMVASDDEEGHRYDFSFEQFMNLKISAKTRFIVDPNEQDALESFVEGMEWNRLQHVPLVWMRKIW